ncbi:TPA: hypothetical protein I7715_22135, partial [Vibrio vulnificus]|nr:hypothetical protein [Vibrio vulnificus]
LWVIFAMINVSKYWKDDLLKLAEKLTLRLVQKRWGEKNIYTLEKDIFLGFYSVRKLIESRKISDSVKNQNYKVRKINFSGDPDKIIPSSVDSDYDLVSSTEIHTLNTMQICNQFIHSYYFVPFFPTGTSPVGFFVCSDFDKKNCIYFITIFDVVEIFKTVGENYPTTMTIEKLQNGKIRTKIE